MIYKFATNLAKLMMIPVGMAYLGGAFYAWDLSWAATASEEMRGGALLFLIMAFIPCVVAAGVITAEEAGK